MRQIFGGIMGLCFWLLPLMAFAQSTKTEGSFVDKEGIIRWHKDQSEVQGFGVNYSLPFAHAYRMAQRMGIAHEEAIQQDIYHFARLDFDLYRVHVWDTEISDSLGNLLQNDHLRLFDFAVAEMKKRGIKFVITPIAYWGNGWPEKDFPTPGFAAKYGKADCLTHPDALKAQENYLAQFLNHVNPYTGVAYKSDPDIIAFEISNEPHHKGTYEEVKAFINRMVKAMRGTGTDKPLFYNMSHSIHLADAYLDAEVQGGTFQWYPTNLVANHQINGNFLPHVNHYEIPFSDDPRFKKKARLVYEFDAADVEGNYMYPAMARSLRTAGMQVATQFDYDAMFLAPYNTNYGTHYMSLPYAPQKALSLKIASAVFHQMPLHQSYGKYPDNNTFDSFRVDYSSNLAEMVTETRYFYSNHTLTPPPSPEKLQEIAGYGNSPLVSYDGKGAYFIDKLNQNTWRLEVMPDAHWLSDPYTPISPDRQVAAVSYNKRKMHIDLPVLGRNFSITGINDQNKHAAMASNGHFEIKPGVYLLQKAGSKGRISSDAVYKNIRINEFVAPQQNLTVTLVKNQTALNQSAGMDNKIIFEVIAPHLPQTVEVRLLFPGKHQSMKATYVGQDIYELNLPKNLTAQGTIQYNIILNWEEGSKTFPAGLEGHPGEWDYYDRSTYVINLLPHEAPIVLWDAQTDWEKTMRPWHPGIYLKPALEAGKSHLVHQLDEIPLSQDGIDTTRIYTFKYHFRDKIKGRQRDLADKSQLVLKAKSLNNHFPTLEVALIDNRGMAYSQRLILNAEKGEYNIQLNELSPAQFALVPRPYPEFMSWLAPFWPTDFLDLSTIETLQISLVPDNEMDQPQPLEFYLQEIWLE